MFWQSVLRPLMFCLPAETAHYFSMGAFSTSCMGPFGRLIKSRYSVRDQRLETNLFGLDFQNPVGLAAGFDKDARWYRQLGNLGFGHVEVGTLTGKPQVGNEKPRLFRLPADKAIINRMGFNNQGSDAAARRFSNSMSRSDDVVLGINIGKTKVVPVEDATSDYLFSFERLYSFADYFTVNVSSPNTPGLRTLQNREPLVHLLSSINELNQRLAGDHEIKPKPVLLKIAPDVTPEQLADIVLIAREVKISGIIATNTTLDRHPLVSPSDKVTAIGAGGLSGQPLTMKSRNVVAQLYAELGADVPIIGVGGIMKPDDAWQMILAGASMVQIYTGFIYGGPSFVRSINRYLIQKVEQNNLANIKMAVGGSGRLD